MAAFFHFAAGVRVHLSVATTIGRGIIDPADGDITSCSAR